MCSNNRRDLEIEIYDLNHLDEAEQRFKDLVHDRLTGRCEVDPETDCWIYTGSWDSRGVAKMRVGNRVATVGRVAAWLYMDGFELWDPRWVYHSEECPNLACFNVEHLRLADSRKDAMARLREMGRMQFPQGSAGRFTWLCAEQVGEIRRRLAAGESRGALAKEYGLRRTWSVTMIALNLSWRQSNV